MTIFIVGQTTFKINMFSIVVHVLVLSAIVSEMSSQKMFKSTIRFTDCDLHCEDQEGPFSVHGLIDCCYNVGYELDHGLYGSGYCTNDGKAICIKYGQSSIDEDDDVETWKSQLKIAENQLNYALKSLNVSHFVDDHINYVTYLRRSIATIRDVIADNN